MPSDVITTNEQTFHLARNNNNSKNSNNNDSQQFLVELRHSKCILMRVSYDTHYRYLRLKSKMRLLESSGCCLEAAGWQHLVPKSGKTGDMQCGLSQIDIVFMYPVGVEITLVGIYDLVKY